MYVCVCNAVTEDDVRGCLDGGACTPREVKDQCGMKPGCGSCTKRLYAMVSEFQTASELAEAMTGGPMSPVMPVGEVAGTDEAGLSEARSERGSAPPTAA